MRAGHWPLGGMGLYLMIASCGGGAGSTPSPPLPHVKKGDEPLGTPAANELWDGMSNRLRLPNGESVPVLPAAGARLRPADLGHPVLEYRGGALQKNIRIVALFIGSYWRSHMDTVGEVDAFNSQMVSSELWESNLSQYGGIGKGSNAGAILVDEEPSFFFTDDAAKSLVKRLIAAGTAPPPTPDTNYLIALPPNVTSVLGLGASCIVYCAYHNTDHNGIVYQVIPFPGCAPCKWPGARDDADSMTTVISHESEESATDADTTEGWRDYSGTQSENADLCAGSTMRVDGFLWQKQYSNAAVRKGFDGCVFDGSHANPGCYADSDCQGGQHCTMAASGFGTCQ